MRLQIASDLHLERIARHFPSERLIRPTRGADALVLAGDIASGVLAIERFADWPVPVLYVPGNHEMYGTVLEDAVPALRERARGTAVRVLEREVAEFEGVRVLGTALWTDYRLHPGQTPQQAMYAAGRSMGDHYAIRVRDGGFFTPAHALQEHETARAWLERELHKPYAGATVVVTHHGPHPQSVHPKYEHSDCNAAFVSDLTPLLEHADFWLHGHVHDTFDYHVGRCRVLANPRGYARNASGAPTARDLQFENPAFRPTCLIDTCDARDRGAMHEPR